MYEIIKALHVISVIAWMAGLFYLPRLFIYHVSAEKGSDKSETFKVMERRLLRAIMNPAMMATWAFGLFLLIDGNWIVDGWAHVKLTAVVCMTVFHMACARWRKAFENDQNAKSEKFFRIANEVPTLLLFIIVFMVIVKPF